MNFSHRVGRVRYVLLLIAFNVLFYSLDAQTLPGYIDRFHEIRDEFYNPANGYFSADGAPYHSIETLIVEAPDQGHESTSELYSYWIWLEAMHGNLTGDWAPLNAAWAKMEEHIIPASEDQPNTADYDPSSPATYAPEMPLPEDYPAPLNTSISVGEDPVSPDLYNTYGTYDIYGMHWLIDCDNFYGYGNRGDGVSTPSYINTFQRGAQESTWETVPHPSWDDFSWGGSEGYLPIFTLDGNYAEQWRYTNAPDADGRVVQAIYWAYLWAQEQGLDPASTLPLGDAVRMGDYLRLAMFDKYFKPLGTQSPQAAGGQGYESAHYLMSWYYSWGGKVPVEGENFGWSWRIGSSHCHIGYQNPVAAWVLSNVPDFAPQSENGARDWGISFDRQMEFYEYLQSPQGVMAGGATNSWNGDYSPHPAGKSTFYGMAYDENPVYEDPGSNTWPGFQGWTMERIAELYYLNNDQRAKAMIEKWADWAISEIQLLGDNDFRVPARFEWTGEPDTWTGAPSANAGLSVEVAEYGTDLGVAASYARTLIYYAAATEAHDQLDEEARDMAKEILDRMWITYRDEQGLSSTEERGDYSRFFEQEVYVPAGFSGTMPSGDAVESGVTFFDIRTQYADDPMYADLVASYEAGEDFAVNYHRGWAQIEIALANAEYGIFFGDGEVNDRPSVTITSPEDGAKFQVEPSDVTVTAEATDEDGTIVSVAFLINGELAATDSTAPYSFTFEGLTSGTYEIEATATDDAGASVSDVITVSVGNAAPIASFIADPTSGGDPLTVNFDASASTDPDGDVLTYSWDFGDGSTGTGALVDHTYLGLGSYVATLTVSDGNGGSDQAVEIIEVVELVCDLATIYEVPRATSLPTINNASYDYIYVLGEGGPDLSNVTNFTINWANESWGSGLWQMSFQTSNGVPGWWNNMLQVSSNTFNQTEPEVTFSGSGFSGLDGSYYVNQDGSNLVFVAVSGSYALYFSNSATAPEACQVPSSQARQYNGAEHDLSEVLEVYPNPSSNAFIIHVKNGETITGVSLYNTAGQLLQFIPRTGDGQFRFGEHLESGVYLLKISRGKVSETLTLVKE